MKTLASCMPFYLLLLLVAIELIQRTVVGVCPPNGCGPYGTCRRKTTRNCNANNDEDCEYACDCDAGFAGFDCSFQVVVCPGPVGPDGAHACYNGGQCLEKPYRIAGEGTYDWRCDCISAVGDAAIFRGHQCEYPSEVSCELGRTTSSFAFCTNGGTCREHVYANQPHVPCVCKSGFEGIHCQYAAGTAPLGLDTANDGPLSRTAIALIVVTVLCAAAVAFALLIKRYYYHCCRSCCCKEEKGPPRDIHAHPKDLTTAHTPSDLTLEQQVVHMANAPVAVPPPVPEEGDNADDHDNNAPASAEFTNGNSGRKPYTTILPRAATPSTTGNSSSAQSLPLEQQVLQMAAETSASSSSRDDPEELDDDKEII